MVWHPGQNDLLDGDIGFPGPKQVILQTPGLGPQRGVDLLDLSLKLGLQLGVFHAQGFERTCGLAGAVALCAARLAALAAVAARPTLVLLMVLRPEQRTQHRAAHRDGGVPGRSACLGLLALQPLVARRICSWIAASLGAYLARSASTFWSRSSRDAWTSRSRNSRSVSPGRDDSLSAGQVHSSNVRSR